MTDSRWLAFIPLSVSIIGLGLGLVLWQMDEAVFRGIERSVSFLDFRNQDLPWFGLSVIGCTIAVFAGAERWRSIGGPFQALTFRRVELHTQARLVVTLEELSQLTYGLDFVSIPVGAHLPTIAS